MKLEFLDILLNIRIISGLGCKLKFVLAFVKLAKPLIAYRLCYTLGTPEMVLHVGTRHTFSFLRNQKSIAFPCLGLGFS